VEVGDLEVGVVGDGKEPTQSNEKVLPFHL
jgi:hypothetical protein